MRIAILSFSQTEDLTDGMLRGDPVTITVTARPTSLGADNGSFTIETNNGSIPMSWNLTAYDTPTLSRITPAVGSNNSVNVAINDNVTFEVTEIQTADLLLPDAAVKGYQWQALRLGNIPTWSTTDTASDSHTKLLN
ncbi:hypothetical protein IH992_29820 [Candidatus Poribacteria bacterium]|nr:hypothetical protein [Candidatus Poribacteria bacterium]